MYIDLPLDVKQSTMIIIIFTYPSMFFMLQFFLKRYAVDKNFLLKHITSNKFRHDKKKLDQRSIRQAYRRTE